MVLIIGSLQLLLKTFSYSSNKQYEALYQIQLSSNMFHPFSSAISAGDI